MNAMLLRIGIDTGCGGLAPIFADGSFEFIPIPERYDSSESRTYGTIKGRSGKSLSEFLPGEYSNKTVHYDPEFDTCTYGDPTTKRTRLLKLAHGDLLVFYAGLEPFNNAKYERALYIIGYFTIDKVIDFDKLSEQEIEKCFSIYHNNAHIKRNGDLSNLVLVAGDKERSMLLNRAIRISQLKRDSRGSRYHVVSEEMEKLLGIRGSIQRAATPRIITDEVRIQNLKNILNYP
jgi:hypothetical protein